MAANAISKEGHGCIHSQLTSGHEQTSLTYKASSQSSRGRKLTMNGREPIRVHVEKMTSSLSAELDELLYDEVLPAAVSYINSALAVTPVSGQLLFSRKCGGTWNTGTPNVCALEGPNECGSSSDVSRATIPDALLDALRVCSTCSGDSCDEDLGSNCANFDAGAGVAADVAILVTAVDSNLCDGSTTAYAAACRFDQYDRPILGHANF